MAPVAHSLSHENVFIHTWQMEITGPALLGIDGHIAQWQHAVAEALDANALAGTNAWKKPGEYI